MTPMNQAQQRALYIAIQNKFNDYGSRVHIYESGFCGDKIRYVVNWYAIGDATPKEALQFREEVETAAKVCEALNKMDLERHWEENDSTTKEQRDQLVKDYEIMLDRLAGRKRR